MGYSCPLSSFLFASVLGSVVPFCLSFCRLRAFGVRTQKGSLGVPLGWWALPLWLIPHPRSLCGRHYWFFPRVPGSSIKSVRVVGSPLCRRGFKYKIAPSYSCLIGRRRSDFLFCQYATDSVVCVLLHNNPFYVTKDIARICLSRLSPT